VTVVTAIKPDSLYSIVYQAFYTWGRFNMAIDPVCKMQVDEKKAPAKSEYKGKTYYFCALGCKKAFDANPEKYLAAEKK